MGFAVSIVVPARAGELARAEWLGRRTGLPRATVLGSIVLDHLVNARGHVRRHRGAAPVPPPAAWLHSGDLAGPRRLRGRRRRSCSSCSRAASPPRRGRGPDGRGSAAWSPASWRRRALGLTAMQRPPRAGPRVRRLAAGLDRSRSTWSSSPCTPSRCSVPLGVEPARADGRQPRARHPLRPARRTWARSSSAPRSRLMEYGVPKEQALAFALVYHFLQMIPIGIAGLVLAGRLRCSVAVPVPENARP